MRLRDVFGSGWRHGLAVGAICAVVGLAGSALLLHAERDRLLAEDGARLADYARVMAQRLDSGLVEWAHDVGLMARFEAFSRQPPEPAMARRLMEDLQTRSPTFAWIGFAGVDGRVIAATGGLLEGVDVAARPWFAPGLKGLHLGDVHPAALLARLLPAAQGGGADAYFVDAAAPVHGEDGRVIGVIAGHLTWRWAESVRREISRLSPWQPAPTLLVVGADRTVLLGPERLRGKPWAGAMPPGPGLPAWREAEGEGPALLQAFANADEGGSDRPALGWVVVAERDTATILASLWGFALWLGLGTLVLAGVGGALAGRNAHRFGGAVQRVLGEGRTGPELEARLLQLRDQAWHDPLTGLLNRAGLAAWAAGQPGLAAGAAVVVLDLDGFKPVNDRHGHAAGDAVLQAIGAWLRRHLRDGDAAVRLGGDEFLLCLPGRPERVGEAAAGIAAGLDAMLRAGLDTPAGRVALGCSAGVAVMPRDAATLDAAIGLADAALYETKRNRAARERTLS
ncbi:sensor domain-containing diguanylate cyclase [Roseomonas sp. USHLN139]|uniref:sensor domain-containing diguanylate cyclase n=1 Tax=Roseomonas sp. USHLN139 TaxID=3081298 RepID=UPI003B018F74